MLMDMRIGIIFNDKKKEEIKKPVSEVFNWLKSKKHAAYVNPDENILKKGLNFIIAFGGDGSFLFAADKIAEYPIPLVGVNFGNRGYLCEIEKKNIYDGIEKLFDGKYKIQERTRIQAEIFHDNEKIGAISGLNEIYIGGINRTVFVSVKTIDRNESFKAKVTGDGVIFSTKTGSTAYNMNAGGPVLVIDGFSVVANNAMFESDILLPSAKSFVTSAKAVFKAELLNEKKQNLPYLVADGQRNYKFRPGDYVIIKKSPKSNYFVKL